VGSPVFLDTTFQAKVQLQDRVPARGGSGMDHHQGRGAVVSSPIVDHLAIADDRDTRLDNIGLLLITYRYRVTSKGETGGSHS
jgi:hypothetical protein